MPLCKIYWPNLSNRKCRVHRASVGGGCWGGANSAHLDRKLRAGPKGAQGLMERRKHHPSFFLPYTSCHRLDRTFLIGD